MPKVRLNYDGWLALPAAARCALGVDTGDQLEAEVVDGRIVFHPLKAAVDSSADKELPPAAVEPVAAATSSSDVKRGRGRPRKVAAPSSAASSVLPPSLKALGMKRKTAVAGEPSR